MNNEILSAAQFGWAEIDELFRYQRVNVHLLHKRTSKYGKYSGAKRLGILARYVFVRSCGTRDLQI